MARISLAFVLIPLLLVPASEALLCKCDICTNYTCEVDGGKFSLHLLSITQITSFYTTPHSDCVITLILPRQFPGKCYTTAEKKKTEEGTVIQYGYRCLTRSQLLPPENPMWCQRSRQKMDTFNIICCDSHDFCELLKILSILKLTPFLQASQLPAQASQRLA